MTDLKDRHPASLVNKITSNLVRLTRVDGLDNIIILMGNHDCIDPNNPFFEFLKDVRKIKFITRPTDLDFGVDGGDDCDLLFLPHSRDPIKDWEHFNFKLYDYIFMHQTMNGAVASSGQELEGLREKIFKGCRAKIISGDIHVPQELGKVTYVGSPYRITFGDTFHPRVLVLEENGQTFDIYFNTVYKHTANITNPEQIKEINTRKGDQIKVVLKLKKSELFEWEKYKRKTIKICKDLDLELCALELERAQRKSLKGPETPDEYETSSHNEIFDEFCKLHEIDEYTREVGQALLK
jgi:hypothetical protein